MTTAIKYSVQGRAKEQTVSCYTIPSKIVTLRHIRRQFPFYGRFHFRCRFPPDRETNFAWMDLLDPDEPVPSFGGTIYLKVLQIPTPDSLLQDDETNTLQPAAFPSTKSKNIGLEFVESITSEEVREKVDKVAEDLKKNAQKVTRSIGKNLGKLWGSASQFTNAAAGAFGTFGSKESRPSPAAITQLCVLEVGFASPFANGFQEHEDLLMKLWKQVFPSKSFQSSSPLWKKIGFQREDPRLDLRGGGILSLKCLVYFSSEYSSKVADMVRSQSKNSPNTYPFGAVGVNITLLLGDLLKLRDRKFEGTEVVFWGVFEDSKAFFELYCLTFRYLDHIWTTSRAERKQFSQVIGKCKAAVAHLLSLGPTSLGNLMELAHQNEYLF